MTALRGKDIIMFSLMRFDDPIESSNYAMAKELARHNRVFYVDNPYTFKDVLELGGTPGHACRKRHFDRNKSGVIDTDIPNLKVVITPPVMSINWMAEGRLYRAALRLSEGIIRRRIQRIISQYRVESFVFINAFNFHYPDVAKGLQPALTVYYCVDPLVFDFDRRHGAKSEEKLVRESNVVICSSKSLADEKRVQNSQTYFVPNAANVGHSAKARAKTLPVDEVLAGIPSPIVGYFGAVERRMDYALLEKVIAANPALSFVFVGPVSAEHTPRAFRAMKNVYLRGPVPYERMPGVLKGFDTAIIPFKKDEVSGSIFPLKLFEYLGAGKAVVATDFNPDLKEFTGDAVRYCEDAEEFSAALAAAILPASAETIAVRVAIAQENTWEHRGEDFMNILAAHLEPSNSCKLAMGADSRLPLKPRKASATSQQPVA